MGCVVRIPLPEEPELGAASACLSPSFQEIHTGLGLQKLTSRGHPQEQGD